MSTVESGVVGHYGSGTLFDRIMAGLEIMGVSPDDITRDHLKPVDEFHIGALEATNALLEQLDIRAGDLILDIGSGIGGTARHMAHTTGAKVVGIDLTPEFVEVAKQLSELVGDQTDFRVGSAYDLPLDDNVADFATLLHVGMNIPDKQQVFTEAFRVLRAGGTFAVYDVMRMNEEPIEFPVPWATKQDQSFVETPDTYRRAAEETGFKITSERDRGDFAREYYRLLADKVSSGGPPPFSTALTMGEGAANKIRNMVLNLNARRYAPYEMICRKPGG